MELLVQNSNRSRFACALRYFESETQNMAGVSWGNASLVAWSTASVPQSQWTSVSAPGFPLQMEKLGWDFNTGEFLDAITGNWGSWWLVAPACSVLTSLWRSQAPSELQRGSWVAWRGVQECLSRERSHYCSAKPLTSALLLMPALFLWEKCKKWFNLPLACYHLWQQWSETRVH